MSYSGSTDGMPKPLPWIGQTHTRHAIVLLYHRISDADDVLQLSVSPQSFAQHVAVFKRSFTLLTPKEFSEALEKKTFPERAVLLTFDDGYVDLVQHALPVLRSAAACALAFVCGGERDTSDTEFWWEKVQRLFRDPTALPRSLSVSVDTTSWSFDMSKGDILDTVQFLTKHMPLLSLEKQEYVLRQLESQLKHVADPVPDKVSKDDLKTLADSGHVTIGGHSANHLRLGDLTLRQQMHEIVTNKRFIEQATGVTTDCFAYPYGSPGEFSKDTVSIVQECGYRLAFAANPEVVWPATSPFILPRLMVRDCGSQAFQTWLDSWFPRE